MKEINLKVKKLHPEAVIPSYAKFGDAGMDLTATEKSYDEYGNAVYKIGLAFEIPLGYVGLLFPRSSNSKQDLILSNSVGVIDSGYRGEVMVKFKRVGTQEYSEGERIAQLVIMQLPYVNIEESEELSSSERGEGGFGSTGK
ncbi:MAG: dUTP diphosphatase [Bacteroidota bacterium]|jgi:dUTP pyrophosphatase